MPYFRERSPLWWAEYMWHMWILPLGVIALILFVVFACLMHVTGLW